MNKLFKKVDFDYSSMKKEIKDNLGIDVLDKDVTKMYCFMEDEAKCKMCKGLDFCTQTSLGYYPVLKEGSIIYTPCDYKKENIKKSSQNELIKTLYLPKKILEADLVDFRLLNNSRKEAFKYATMFVSEANKEFHKGMYLSGRFQVGKTYLLAAIANELAKNNVKSILIYFPDLARDLKSSISNGTLEEKVNMLKTIDVLMIDDIGSENMTTWLRDEILGPVLQYRILDQKPVFFSSNKELRTLIEHLSNASSIMDKEKGARIFTRILDLSQEFVIEGNI